ncbi:imelysin family protein [Phaeobacter sp.]|uniref:imelysin family protein n=1 Tax=Phaeobacter sp. TaxID=1902409 RepID=UPI002600E0DF|nr:imelysin family protein [Phaeobacter sp.]
MNPTVMTQPVKTRSAAPKGTSTTPARLRASVWGVGVAMGLSLLAPTGPLQAETKTAATAATQMATTVPALVTDQQVEWILTQHILPGFDQLASQSAALAQTANQTCRHDDPALQQAFADAFDAWIRVNHLRFGPTEAENRAFALAFWPDTRGKIPDALRQALLADAETTAGFADPAAFATQSVALRGFYALEYLLYDATIRDVAEPAQTCALIRAIATDIAATTAAIRADWHTGYADQLRRPGDRYRSDSEVRQELFKALNTGLQLLGDMRLGRPLGGFDKPRPKRAEAWRSARSLHHIRLTLAAMEPLALALAAEDTALADQLRAAFDKARARAAALQDPTLASVTIPAERFRIETLLQDVTDLREIVATELGPRLGVNAGFNSLDGD